MSKEIKAANVSDGIFVCIVDFNDMHFALTATADVLLCERKLRSNRLQRDSEG